MDLLTPSPLSLTHFLQPWSSKFSQGFDIFFDAFSNSLVLFKDGYFIVWDQFDRMMSGTNGPSPTLT